MDGEEKDRMQEIKKGMMEWWKHGRMGKEEDPSEMVLTQFHGAGRIPQLN